MGRHFFQAGIFFFFLACVVSPARAEKQLVDRIVAVVNDDAITQSELDVLFLPVHAQLTQALQGAELVQKLNEARRGLLNQLIEDRLILQAAKKAQIEVTDPEVEERFQEFKKQFHSEEEFEQLMNSQNVELKAIKKRIHDQIAIQKMYFIEVQRTIVVSPVEIEKFYADHQNEFVDREQVNVWSITIPKNEQAIAKGTMDEAAKKKADELLKAIKKGKDFSECARQESRDPHAKDGGLIGYVSRGDMIPPIDDVLFRLPDQSVSDVLETETAYHLFKVGDHQPERQLSFDEVREKISDLLYREKSNARFQVWIEELKKSAFISIR